MLADEHDERQRQHGHGRLAKTVAVRFAQRSLLLVVLCCVGCGPAGTAARSAADRRSELRARLAASSASPDTSVTLQRSRILRALGQQEQALAELDAAVAAARERLDWDALGALWREMGGIYLEQEQPEVALAVFGKRLKAAESLDEAPARALALVDTADAFAVLGHLAQASDAVTQARVLAGAALDRDPIAVERLAAVAERLGDEARARVLYTDAAVQQRQRGEAASAVRDAVEAARLAVTSGEADALDRQRAVAAALADPGPLARLRRYQAERDFGVQSYDACERRARDAVRLADARGLTRTAKVARVLAARCGDLAGHLPQALAAAREAGSMAAVALRAVKGNRTRQHLSHEAFLIYRLLLELEAKQHGPGRVARAFAASERARARAHLDTMAQSQLGMLSDALPVPPALEQRRAAAAGQLRRATRAQLSGQRRPRAASTRDALWALEDIDEAIARANPLLSRVTPPEMATVDTVRRQLVGKGGLLLSYFVTDERTYLFAIDSEQATLDPLPVSSDELGAVVESYREHYLLQPGAGGAAGEQGRALYDKLLGPVAKRLAVKRRLVVVPHGALSTLPFESLRAPDGRYLVQDHEVSYLVSATVGAALAEHDSSGGEAALKGFVGMGDPIYDWRAFHAGHAEGRALASTRALELWNVADKQAQGSVRGLERLPGTARELRAIARLFGTDQKLYLRAQASEQNVKRGVLGGYRMVHIASHGLLSRRYQALALSLLPDAQEDGFLLGREIAHLELDADLVVLSACRTGVSHQIVAGEPVAGLTLSLRAAGARQVVLSLWSVDDEATSQLMVDLYRPLAGGSRDYAAALAEAKRKMVASGKWAHPYYWAPFVLHGAARAAVGQTDGGKS